MATTTQCKLPECKYSSCASDWMQEHHQHKLQMLIYTTMCASGLSELVCNVMKKHQQRKLQLVITATCAS